MADQVVSFPPGVMSSPIAGATQVSNIFVMDFTTTFGAISSLIGTTKTFNVPGLQTTDFVSVKCTGSMTTGCTIANARVSAADTLEITFTTAVALGLTLGSLNFRLFVLRP